MDITITARRDFADYDAFRDALLLVDDPTGEGLEWLNGKVPADAPKSLDEVLEDTVTVRGADLEKFFEWVETQGGSARVNQPTAAPLVVEYPGHFADAA